MTAHVAAHRAPKTLTLEPGQQLAVRLAAVVLALFTVPFLYGFAQRNPIVDTVAAADAIWTVGTSLRFWATILLAAGAVWYLRTNRKGSHRHA